MALEIRRNSLKELTLADLKQSEPVLVTDGLSDWPAFKHWTPELFAAVAPERTVKLARSYTGYFRFNPDGSPKQSDQFTFVPNVPLPEAVRWITSGDPAMPRCYVIQQDIRQLAPTLLSDLRPLRPLDPEPGKLNLWFGSSGTITDLHFDGSNNLYAQIFGSKEFIIFPPQDTGYLCPFEPGCKMSHVSPLDPDAPNLEHYPLYGSTRPISFTIQPGQLLFLPAFWWHRVRSLTTSISVNQWWTPELTQCVGPGALHLLRSEYSRDRWATICLTEGFSRERLIDSAEKLVEVNLPAAVLAAAVALDSAPANQGARRLLAHPGISKTWQSLVSAAERGDDLFGGKVSIDGVKAVVRKMLSLLQSGLATASN